MPAQPEFQQRLQSMERLLGKIESAADPALRTTVQELVQLVMDLHGAGLERMLEWIRASGDGGTGIIQKLERDELVASLLVLHGLHPMDIEARVTQALDKARSRLRAHEGEVELLSIQDGAVRLRLYANGHGCGSTAQTLKEMVEDAVYQGAPDVTALVIESAGAESAGRKPGFVPIEMLQGPGRKEDCERNLADR
jgi:Fe-S cluster biogenesis protein NfuA